MTTTTVETARITWTGPIAAEDTMTGDGRYIKGRALRWGTLPIPVRWAESDFGSHDGAKVVGKINSLARVGKQIIATGEFDLGSEHGREAARQVREGLTPGISVDLDEISFELRVAKNLAEESVNFNLEDGEGPERVIEMADDGRVITAKVKADDEIMVTTDARIRAATLVALPAFEAARINLTASMFAYNPRQARVPKNSGKESGRWVDTPGKLGESLSGSVGQAAGRPSQAPSTPAPNNDTGPSSSAPQPATQARERAAASLAAAAITGGFTYNLRSGEFPVSGYAVARPGTFVVKAPTEDSVAGALGEFIKAHPDIEVIGGWYDRNSGQVEIDTVDIITDRTEAIARARAQNQKAIFDLGAGEEIDTGGTGDSEREFRTGQAGAGTYTGRLRRPARGRAGTVPARPRQADSWHHARRSNPLSPRRTWDGRPGHRLNLERWHAARLISANYGFNPNQARVPKGNGRASGRWVDTPGNLGVQMGSAIGGTGGGSTGSEVSGSDSDAPQGTVPIPPGSTPETDRAAVGIGQRGRPDGAGTFDDPIDVQGDISKAADLIAEGKHVRLNQEMELSTLIDELGARMKADQEAGRQVNYDLCTVSVAGSNLFCQENKGIPRVEMPQFSGVPTPGSIADGLPKNAKGEADATEMFKQQLRDRGVTVTPQTVPVGDLKGTQNQLVGGKVLGMMGALESTNGAHPGITEPIFVSRDGYVVDGHHRWAAQVAYDVKPDGTIGQVDMQVNVIDMDIGEILDLSNAFMLDVGLKAKAAGAGQENN